MYIYIYMLAPLDQPFTWNLIDFQRSRTHDTIFEFQKSYTCLKFQKIPKIPKFPKIPKIPKTPKTPKIPRIPKIPKTYINVNRVLMLILTLALTTVYEYTSYENEIPPHALNDVLKNQCFHIPMCHYTTILY